jgi:hypothetical protein
MTIAKRLRWKLAGTSTIKNEKRRLHFAPGVNERQIAKALTDHRLRTKVDWFGVTFDPATSDRS